MSDKVGARERIMETVIALLEEGKDISRISNREIAALAGVNSALINYYYQSKDNLISLAAGACMARIGGMLSDHAEDATPAQRIKSMLKKFSEFCFRHSTLAEIAVSSELKAGSLQTSKMLYPLFREHFGERKTDMEIKLMTLQLLNPMQLLFLNRHEYKGYLTLDIDSPDTWDTLVDTLIDNLLERKEAQ